MPIFSGAQHSETTGGVYTDVAGDYNSLSSGGRGGSSVSHITLNLGGQGVLDPSIRRHDDWDDPGPWFATGSEQSPSDIYSRLLLPKRHGYPLWFPEPRKELSNEYRSVGVEIGDVGMITFDGGFDFLFNICRPADDPVNSQGVPASFKPVHLKSEHVREISDMHSVGTHISSACIYTAGLGGEDSNSLRGRPARFCGGLKFECSDSMGAVLVLPEGGFRKDLLAKRLFLQYAMRNAAEWYQFATGPDLGREAENGSLYLVTGCDKSPAWGVASCYHPSGNTRVSFKFMAAGAGDDDDALVYSWKDYSPATVRMSCQDRSRFDEARHLPTGSAHDGPEYDGLNPRPTFNQCVFIRGYRISLEPRYMGWLLGEKVKIEEGINPMAKHPDSTLSSLSLSSTRGSSSLQAHTHNGSLSVNGRQNSNQRMDALSECDPNVLLENISGMASPYHPLVSINKYLLDTVEGSKIAITHDDDWLALLEDSDSKLPEDTVLIQQLAREDIIQDGDVVYLAFQDQNIYNSSASRESPQEHQNYLYQQSPHEFSSGHRYPPVQKTGLELPMSFSGLDFSPRPWGIENDSLTSFTGSSTSGTGNLSYDANLNMTRWQDADGTISLTPPLLQPEGSSLDLESNSLPSTSYLGPETPLSSVILRSADHRRRGIAGYRCSFCPQTLTSRHNLLSHEDVHQNIKRFPCEHCGRRFRTRSVLQRHQRGSRCQVSRLEPQLEDSEEHPSTDFLTETSVGTPQTFTYSPQGSTRTLAPTPMPLTPIQGEHTLPRIVQRYPSPDYDSPPDLHNNTTDPDVKEEKDVHLERELSFESFFPP